jgi:hypothetical protein
MTPQLETGGSDLDEARERSRSARQALQAAPQDIPEIRQAVAWLARMEAELGRIDGVLAGQAVRTEVV